MPEPLPPQFKILAEGSAETTQRRRVIQFGGGYKQRTPEGLNTKTEDWNVAIITKTIAQLNALEVFLEGRSCDPIQWTPPTATSPKLFLVGGWGKQHLGGTAWKVSFKMEFVSL